MLPWAVAALRGKSNHWTIFWINLLGGWTVILWIVALVAVATPTARRPARARSRACR